jgi:hypothetical protein
MCIHSTVCGKPQVVIMTLINHARLEDGNQNDEHLLSVITFSLSSFALNHFDATNEVSATELPITSAPNK